MDPILARARAIRKATPDVLPQLFEMQNGLCDLCGQPIQDVCLAALEHSVPVNHYARSPLPIEEAIEQCNAPGNLRAAHYSCNSAKSGLTREEWYAHGYDKSVGKPRLLNETELAAWRAKAKSNTHKRWHLNRGLVPPGTPPESCQFCKNGGRGLFPSKHGVLGKTAAPGTRFGRLTILESLPVTKHGDARCRCRCDCGKETQVRFNSLIRGLTKSCGCLRRERMQKANRQLWEWVRQQPEFQSVQQATAEVPGQPSQSFDYAE